jgi:3-hydroxybutyrate dehydrogenase
MLAGKSALVTGSVAGLGYAIAEGLAKAGASVTLNALCPAAEGETAARSLAQRTGADVAFDGCDLSMPDQIARMMARAAERFDGLDIVVNNAVVRHFSSIDAFDPRDWDRSLAVNLSAAFHTIRLALPHMNARGWGRIINLSSIYGFRGAENRIDYVTTKTALIGLTRAVAIETAKTGVTCNALCPGTVRSPAIVARIEATAKAQGISIAEAERAYIASRHPTGRFVSMDSVAALAVFLCSPAGADVTGATLPVDGGWQVA